MGPLSNLLACYEQLDAREREALATIASRMLMGQKQYGVLTRRKKDWAKEAFEEACDMAVYTAAKLLDIADDEEDREQGKTPPR